VVGSSSIVRCGSGFRLVPVLASLFFLAAVASAPH
jgi:hypothetical protein